MGQESRRSLLSVVLCKTRCWVGAHSHLEAQLEKGLLTQIVGRTHFFAAEGLITVGIFKVSKERKTLKWVFHRNSFTWYYVKTGWHPITFALECDNPRSGISSFWMKCNIILGVMPHFLHHILMVRSKSRLLSALNERKLCRGMNWKARTMPPTSKSVCHTPNNGSFVGWMHYRWLYFLCLLYLL